MAQPTPPPAYIIQIQIQLEIQIQIQTQIQTQIQIQIQTQIEIQNVTENGSTPACLPASSFNSTKSEKLSIQSLSSQSSLYVVMTLDSC